MQFGVTTTLKIYKKINNKKQREYDPIQEFIQEGSAIERFY